MRIVPSLLLLLFAVSTSSATGDLARNHWKVQIGFAKMDVRPNASPTTIDDSGLSLGLGGKYAFVEMPDLIGLDFDYGYRYRAISGAKMHEFGVGLTPALHVHDFFRPYLPLSIGYNNFSPESSGFFFAAGLGVESEWMEDWSTRLSYTLKYDDLYEINELSLGTSYWFESWGIGLDLDFLSGQRSIKGTDFRLNVGYSY